MAPRSQLDQPQIIQEVYDPVNTALRVNLVASASGGSTVSIVDGLGGGYPAQVTSANALKVDGSGVVQPVSQSGTWTVGLTTESIEIGKVDQGSAGVSAWLVSDATTHTTLSAIATNQTNGNQVVVGAGVPAVPAGGVVSVQGVTGGTAVNVLSVIAGTPNVNVADFGGSAVVTGTGTSGAGIPRVTVSSDSVPATQAISAVSLPLPTGAATSANQTNGTQVVQVSVLPSIPAGSAAIGSVTVSNFPSSSVTVAGGNVPLQFVRNDYSITNVTTGAWVTLIASTSGVTNVIETFDSSGRTMEIGFGPTPTAKFLIFPGGNGRATVAIPSGTQISIQAVSGNAISGEFSMNLFT
jgi:hypothetical protein